MRIVRNFAALVAIATVGFAIGDFASHPNPLGALGLLALISAFAFLLAYLFRSDERRQRQAPAAAPEPEPDPQRRRPASAPTVWTGWQAEEASVAREQRRERERRRGDQPAP